MYLWVIKCNYCYRLYKTIVVLRQHKVEKKFRLFFFFFSKTQKGNSHPRHLCLQLLPFFPTSPLIFSLLKWLYFFNF